MKTKNPIRCCLPLLLGLCLQPAGSHAQPSRNGPVVHDDAYWNRGFGMPQAGDNYSVSLRADEVDALARQVDAVMLKSGATLTGDNRNGFNQSYNGESRRVIQLNYTLPSDSAEKAARKLLEMGELTSYSLNRQNNKEIQQQVQERIGILERELANNKAALTEMPAATYFLTTRLRSLQGSRDAYQRSASKSSISVQLSTPPGKR